MSAGYILAAIGGLAIAGTVVSQIDRSRSAELAFDQTRSFVSRFETVRRGAEAYMAQNAASLSAKVPTVGSRAVITASDLKTAGVLPSSYPTDPSVTPSLILRRTLDNVEGYVVTPPLSVQAPGTGARMTKRQVAEIVRLLGPAIGLEAPQPLHGTWPASPSVISGTQHSWHVDTSALGLSAGAWRVASRITGPTLDRPAQTAPAAGPSITFSTDVLQGTAAPTAAYVPPYPAEGEVIEKRGWEMRQLRFVELDGGVWIERQASSGLRVHWWGTYAGLRNIHLRNVPDRTLSIEGFLDARIETTRDGAGRHIRVYNPKRGSVVTGPGNDDIEVSRYSDFDGDRDLDTVALEAAARLNGLFTIDAGDGDNHVSINEGMSWSHVWNAWYWLTNNAFNTTSTDIRTGSGNDIVRIWSHWRTDVRTGAGNDVIDATNSWNTSNNSRQRGDHWMWMDPGRGDDQVLWADHNNLYGEIWRGSYAHQGGGAILRRGDGNDTFSRFMTGRDVIEMRGVDPATVNIVQNAPDDFTMTYGPGDSVRFLGARRNNWGYDDPVYETTPQEILASITFVPGP